MGSKVAYKPQGAFKPKVLFSLHPLIPVAWLGMSVLPASGKTGEPEVQGHWRTAYKRYYLEII